MLDLRLPMPDQMVCSGFLLTLKRPLTCWGYSNIPVNYLLLNL